MSATPATTLGTSAPASTPVPAAPSGAPRPEPKPLPVAGSGATLGDAAAVAFVGTTGATGLAVELDAFAKRGGPDVAVKTDVGMVAVHAVFQMDPTTNEMRVSIVDEAGRLVRMIPPDSVARMIAAMATYRGR